MIQIETIIRNYNFTQKEIKDKLGIKGNIKDIGLFAGLSPNDVEAGVSQDTNIYSIETTETVQEAKK